MRRAAILLAPGAVAASLKCSTTGSGGSVLRLSDGKNERCLSLVTPPAAKTPMPVLFWFHGAGGNGGNCGNGELGQLAQKHGFALACGEALQDVYGHGGQWAIPEVITDATGTPCAAADSPDVSYIDAAVKALGANGSTYDTTRVFTSGCSMGSAFSGYISQCLKAASPGSITAFATHSTGLKVKGDGLRLPPDNYNPQYTWGECPACQYFPMAPTKTAGLKACIFDNTGDGDFYKTSLALDAKWKALGNKVASTYGSGGHCQIHSFAAIVNCLDDGTGRLLSGGSAPSTPAPAGPAPAPGPAPGPPPGNAPPAACQQCFLSGCPGLHNKNNDACTDCVKQHQGPCTSSCVPYPFPEAMSWFCGSAAGQ